MDEKNLEKYCLNTSSKFSNSRDARKRLTIGWNDKLFGSCFWFVNLYALSELLHQNVYKPPTKRRKPGLGEQLRGYLSRKELTSTLLHLKALLHTAQPSSAEAEKAFSAAGRFSTKIRCRLGDESLNMLAVIRARLQARAMVQSWNSLSSLWQ